MKRTWILIGVLTTLLLSSCAEDATTKSGEKSVAEPKTAEETSNEQPTRSEILQEGRSGASSGPLVTVDYGDAPFLGDSDAPITMIEFSDYQCSFCKSFHDETFPSLKENYIDSGKVKFVFMDMPMYENHSNALISAQAARCAENQGAFWQMHDMLFEKQQEWMGLTDPTPSFVAYANDLELDADSLKSCLENEEMKDRIGLDFYKGQKYDVRVTPTFFINERPLIGAQDLEVFEQILNEAAQ